MLPRVTVPLEMLLVLVVVVMVLVLVVVVVMMMMLPGALPVMLTGMLTVKAQVRRRLTLTMCTL